MLGGANAQALLEPVIELRIVTFAMRLPFFIDGNLSLTAAGGNTPTSDPEPAADGFLLACLAGDHSRLYERGLF